MSWKNLRLASQTAGAEYGAQTLRVAEIMKQVSGSVGQDSRPAVVWFYSPENEKENQSCETNLFQNEQIGLALKKFRCYRLDISQIKNQDIREEYEKEAPSFHFFDPSGEALATVNGKKAMSLSGFSSFVEKTWDTTFTVRLKSYTRSMRKMLDRLDRIEAKKVLHDQDEKRLVIKPNARKQQALAREAKEIEAEQTKFAEDEKKLLDSVQLRPEFTEDELAQSR